MFPSFFENVNRRLPKMFADRGHRDIDRNQSEECKQTEYELTMIIIIIIIVIISQTNTTYKTQSFICTLILLM